MIHLVISPAFTLRWMISGGSEKKKATHPTSATSTFGLRCPRWGTYIPRDAPT